MGPHPAVAAVRRAVRQLVTEVDGPLLVACSGGADSLALAAATAFVAQRSGRPAGLVTVDHGLQQDSAEQAARVAGLGYELGFDPVQAVRVTVRRDGGPEAAARSARYAALAAAADAWGAHVLLGHTMDDQAETVLLGLGRGSGPRSIAGMRTVDGRYLRPFLGLRRATTEAACAALGLHAWSDPHNTDPAFQRVRIRTEVVPVLETILQGGVVEALARTAELLQQDLDALDELSGPPSAGSRTGGIAADGLGVADLEGMHPAIRTRVLRAWAREHGAAPLTAGHTAALVALVTDWHGQGPIDLPGGVKAARRSGRLQMTPSTGNGPGGSPGVRARR